MQMLIKGIRSFSPDNLHVIEFYKPLTLIVGQNGAGKTVWQMSKGAFRDFLPCTVASWMLISMWDVVDRDRVLEASMHRRLAT
jgi:hypothetical protein